jgi:hypothetical protein
MVEHIISFTRPYNDLKKEILETTRHIECDTAEAIKFLDRIETEFQNLVIALENLKPVVKSTKIITEAPDTKDLTVKEKI